MHISCALRQTDLRVLGFWNVIHAAEWFPDLLSASDTHVLWPEDQSVVLDVHCEECHFAKKINPEYAVDFLFQAL